MKKKIFIIIVCIQIIAIIFLFFKIQRKKGNTPKLSVNMIKEGKFISSYNSKLHYFYEPQANSIEEERLPWDTSKKVSIRINSDTLNNHEISKRDTIRNIVVLGDSFAYGQYVETKDNWVSLLENKLVIIDDKIQLINLGVYGYDIEYSVERYRIRGQKYKPNLLIWYLKGDDFISIAEQMTVLLENERMFFIKNEMVNISDLKIPKKGEVAPIYMTRAMNTSVQNMGGIEKVYEYQKKQLRSIRNYYSGTIVIMSPPLEEKHLQLLKEWEKEDKKILLFNLPGRDNSFIFPDTHPNKKGHIDISEALFGYIKKNRELLK